MFTQASKQGQLSALNYPSISCILFLLLMLFAFTSFAAPKAKAADSVPASPNGSYIVSITEANPGSNTPWLINVTLTNNSSQSLTFSRVDTPFMESEIMAVEPGALIIKDAKDNVLPYEGIFVTYADRRDPFYNYTLGPNESLTVKVDLTDAFTFKQNQKYTVQYAQSIAMGSGNNATQKTLLSSNSLSFVAPNASGPKEKNGVGNNPAGFQNCSTVGNDRHPGVDEIAMIKEVVQLSKDVMRKAWDETLWIGCQDVNFDHANRASESDHDNPGQIRPLNIVTTFFGPPGNIDNNFERYAKAQRNWDNLQQALLGDKVRYNCDYMGNVPQGKIPPVCRRGVVAFVNSWAPMIQFCTGKDSPRSYIMDDGSLLVLQSSDFFSRTNKISEARTDILSVNDDVTYDLGFLQGIHYYGSSSSQSETLFHELGHLYGIVDNHANLPGIHAGVNVGKYSATGEDSPWADYPPTGRVGSYQLALNPNSNTLINADSYGQMIAWFYVRNANQWPGCSNSDPFYIDGELHNNNVHRDAFDCQDSQDRACKGNGDKFNATPVTSKHAFFEGLTINRYDDDYSGKIGRDIFVLPNVKQGDMIHAKITYQGQAWAARPCLTIDSGNVTNESPNGKVCATSPGEDVLDISVPVSKASAFYVQVSSESPVGIRYNLEINVTP